MTSRLIENGSRPALRVASRRLAGIALLIALTPLACDRAVLDPDFRELTSPVNTALGAGPHGYSGWSLAVRLEEPGAPADVSLNTSALDGCPALSRDGRTLYFASNRPGGVGGIDIWVSTRPSEDQPWGAPVNVGSPVNSPQNDFCPTPDRDGHRFFFVSNRPGGCGGTDIYVTRLRESGGFEQPEKLGCEADGGPNSAADDVTPFPLLESGRGPVLYFSSTRPGGFAPEAPGAASGDADIYMSSSHGGSFGPAELVPGVNSDADDAQPNLRRDGLEMFFFSTRPGADGADLYSAVRTKTSATWAAPVNLGTNVNSAATDNRPWISWDGTTLYFGSNRGGGEGNFDIYVTTRTRLTPKN